MVNYKIVLQSHLYWQVGHKYLCNISYTNFAFLKKGLYKY